MSEPARLVAPVAVRLVHLDLPLGPVDLPRASGGGEYRSLLAILCRQGRPLGSAIVPAGRGLVSASTLGAAVERSGVRLDSVARSDTGRTAVADGSEPPAVSVVVTTCQNAEAVQRSVRSILACEYAPLEVVVVENRPAASRTRDLIGRSFSGAEVHYVEERRPGLSWARNAGLRRATGEIVAFTDDDVCADPSWIANGVRGFGHAQRPACVTGLILPLRLETPTQVLLEEFAGFGKGFEPRLLRLPEHRAVDPLFPYTAGQVGSGANLFLRADVAREIGGFEPTLGTGTPAAGGEDLDLFIRLAHLGHAIAYEPSAIVWHEHPSGWPRLRRQVYRYGVGLAAMLTKQMIKGPRRLELLAAVPAGIRHALDPRSPKNARKGPEYPRALVRLEWLGIAMGPVAYLASLARTRRYRAP
jgi:O-antigen biosynthesis protein